MKNRGISLIVLIITIVVIIILATAIIVNLVQTNIIGNANEAVVKQEFKTLQEELDLYIADEYVNSLGEFDTSTLNATTKDKVAKIIPSITKTKYDEYVLIENGKIAISDIMSEPEKTWAMEALGITKTTINTPSETTVVNVGTIVKDVNSTITGNDFEYNNPVIPVGFKAVETTEASWDKVDGIVSGWNNGLVIQDEKLNEFVWVPCTIDGKDGTITYGKNYTYKSSYSASASNTEDDIEALPMKNETTGVIQTEQIEKYGGFYIGRYETGIPADQNVINGESADTSNTTGIPVVKNGATVWTYIDYDKASLNALSLYNNDNVKSGIITGTGWDTVCTWINSETDADGNVVHSVLDSRTWGNYNNSLSPADVTGYSSKQVTGFSEYWKAKNIYDLAGNTYEWTGEKRSEEEYSSNRIARGGGSNRDGSDRSASYRDYGDRTIPGERISFRIVLYVM